MGKATAVANVNGEFVIDPTESLDHSYGWKPFSRKPGDPGNIRLLRSGSVGEGICRTSDIASKLEAIEKSLQAPTGNVEQRVEQAFAGFMSRLESKLSSLGPTKSTPSQPAQVAPEVAAENASSLADAIRTAYQDLCLFLEHESGLVPIPRLYHRMKESMPGLTLSALHGELVKMQQERLLELKILNEVREAVEPEKAIRRGDTLLYFVYWPNS